MQPSQRIADAQMRSEGHRWDRPSVCSSLSSDSWLELLPRWGSFRSHMNRSTADFTPVPTSRRIPSWLRANLLDKTEQPHMRNMHYENLYCRSVPAAFTVQVEITFLTKCSTSFKALNAEILQDKLRRCSKIQREKKQPAWGQIIQLTTRHSAWYQASGK